MGAAAMAVLKNTILERHQARLRMKILMLGRQNGRRRDARPIHVTRAVNLLNGNPSLDALGKLTHTNPRATLSGE